MDAAASQGVRREPSRLSGKERSDLALSVLQGLGIEDRDPRAAALHFFLRDVLEASDLPPDWVAAHDQHRRRYYANTATRASSFEHPLLPVLRTLCGAARACLELDGAARVARVAALQAAWQAEGDKAMGKWRTAERDGRSYYYNAETRETTWHNPEGSVLYPLQVQIGSIAFLGDDEYVAGLPASTAADCQAAAAPASAPTSAPSSSASAPTSASARSRGSGWPASPGPASQAAGPPGAAESAAARAAVAAAAEGAAADAEAAAWRAAEERVEAGLAALAAQRGAEEERWRRWAAGWQAEWRAEQDAWRQEAAALRRGREAEEAQAAQAARAADSIQADFLAALQDAALVQRRLDALGARQDAADAAARQAEAAAHEDAQASAEQLVHRLDGLHEELARQDSRMAAELQEALARQSALDAGRADEAMAAQAEAWEAQLGAKVAQLPTAAGLQAQVWHECEERLGGELAVARRQAEAQLAEAVEPIAQRAAGAEARSREACASVRGLQADARAQLAEGLCSVRREEVEALESRTEAHAAAQRRAEGAIASLAAAAQGAQERHAACAVLELRAEERASGEAHELEMQRHASALAERRLEEQVRRQFEAELAQREADMQRQMELATENRELRLLAEQRELQWRLEVRQAKWRADLEVVQALQEGAASRAPPAAGPDAAAAGAAAAGAAGAGAAGAGAAGAGAADAEAADAEAAWRGRVAAQLLRGSLAEASAAPCDPNASAARPERAEEPAEPQHVGDVATRRARRPGGRQEFWACEAARGWSSAPDFGALVLAPAAPPRRRPSLGDLGGAAGGGAASGAGAAQGPRPARWAAPAVAAGPRAAEDAASDASGYERLAPRARAAGRGAAPGPRRTLPPTRLEERPGRRGPPAPRAPAPCASYGAVCKLYDRILASTAAGPARAARPASAAPLRAGASQTRVGAFFLQHAAPGGAEHQALCLRK